MATITIMSPAWLKQCLGLFPAKSKRKFHLLTLSLLILNLLDLLALVLIGSLSANLLGMTTRTSNIFKVPLFKYFQDHLGAMSLVVLGLFLSKSIGAMLLTRYQFNFLKSIYTNVSNETLKQFFAKPASFVNKFNTESVNYAINVGLDSAIVVIPASFTILVADFVLIFVLYSVLFFFDPILALVGLIYGIALIVLAIKFLFPIAHMTGQNESKSTIEASTILKEMTLGYKELFVAGKIDQFLQLLVVKKTKRISSFISRQFVQTIPKFAFEISIMFGIMIFVVAENLQSNTISEILVSILVFITAAFRFAPSLLRIQTSILVIKANEGLAKTGTDFVNTVNTEQMTIILPLKTTINTEGKFSPEIEVKDLNYVADSIPLLRNISFSIEPGTKFAITGPSGAGKSTLMDCLMGLLIPQKGSIKLSQMEPSEFIYNFAEQVSYLPQKTTVLTATLRDNVHLTINASKDNDFEILEILKKLNLLELDESVLSLDQMIDSTQRPLSSGEIQRIGVARLLLKKPKLIFLDESTSSLDPVTESIVVNAINELSHSSTIVMVAHRLSIIKDFESILYLENGEIAGIGDFNYLRKNVPEFNNQCILLGL